jgi:hypothetical protein
MMSFNNTVLKLTQVQTRNLADIIKFTPNMWVLNDTSKDED